jgi:hypothetical protein
MNSDFERAFVATRYFIGARDPNLAAPLGAVENATRELCERLNHPDRATRAETLATEIGRVVRALEARLFR